MKVVDYGKSMYGGWYANYINENNDYKGVHAPTLMELCSKLGIATTEIKKARRFDN